MDSLKQIPAVEKLANHPTLKHWESRFGHRIRIRIARAVVAAYRAAVQRGDTPSEGAEVWLEREYQSVWDLRLQKVLNATGVVLHTNLGRAPLAREWLDAMAHELDGYCTLEWDKARGERGSRTATVEKLIPLLCDGEAALVVNNNAAALFLILHTLAQGRGVPISRGELVQIGGGFRVPEILEASGARLVEVGTTNMTVADDYARALREAEPGSFGCLLKVHQSCFAILGHTESVPPAQLAQLATQWNLPFVVDLGSGQWQDEGLGEPTVGEMLASGASLVSFSGDKLLGGPQAGLVVGKHALVERLRKSPLYRALRLGKTELFLLERALFQHLSGVPTPTQALLRQTPEALRQRAESLRDRLRQALGPILGPSLGDVRLVEDSSAVGGGATPEVSLPTCLVELPFTGDAAERLARRCLAARPPLVLRRDNKRLRLDPRTIFPAEEALVARTLAACARDSNE